MFLMVKKKTPLKIRALDSCDTYVRNLIHSIFFFFNKAIFDPSYVVKNKIFQQIEPPKLLLIPNQKPFKF